MPSCLSKSTGPETNPNFDVDNTNRSTGCDIPVSITGGSLTVLQVTIKKDLIGVVEIESGLIKHDYEVSKSSL